MAKPLAPFKDLIGLGWNDYLTHWNPTIQMTLWLLLFPILQLGIVIVFHPTLDGATTIDRVFTVLQALMSIWITVRIIRWYLSNFKNDPSYDHDGIQSLKAVPSLIWASILKGLATMGAALLLFFPGLWIGGLLAFTEFFVLEDGKRGTEALLASANLVKGRWWPTFGRLFGMTLIFLVVSMIAYVIISTIVVMIAGLDLSSIPMDAITDPANVRLFLIATSTDQLIANLVQALLIPLFFAWQIRLFHHLKQTA